jgi:uncharacterized protein (TIGR02246 family)
VTFRETLDEHLRAIRARDLPALTATLADDLVLIMADGKLTQRREDFIEAHRGWFAMTNWTLDIEPVQIVETADMGLAVLLLDYRETPADKPPVQQKSHLTLVFLRDGQRWGMIHDQNTPIR